jgi:acetolactate synthase-1/2/3 large subunit
MNVSEYIAAYLADRGVDTVFEVVGGMITHLLDTFHREARIRIVSMHHEQGAAFAAEGFSRMRGLPGIALATSGPGATNLITGIGSCYFDSYPAIFITGQVNRHELKGDRGVRQLGFQETDIISMVRGITKGAWTVNDPAELPLLLEKAFQLALAGRPGPVLIDIPMDVQRMDTGVASVMHSDKVSDFKSPTIVEYEDLREALHCARRPLIIAGGGIRSGGVSSAFKHFVEAVGIPVIASLMGVDCLEWAHAQRVGFFGSYGNRWSNLAIGEADLLLVLGSRLDIRQTGADVGGFVGERRIFHVDVDIAEMNNRVKGCAVIHSELKAFFEALPVGFAEGLPGWDDWKTQLNALRAQYPDQNEFRGPGALNPHVIMHQISDACAPAAAYVVDVGQHQMWAAQSLRLKKDQRFLTSGGMGAMGFSLPAAIGAAFAENNRPIVVIAGDGSFQLNIQELETVSHHRLPIKMIVINNACHGMVRQFQESYFSERYQSTVWGYSSPDFARLAEAYGIAAISVAEIEALSAGFELLWRDPESPFLLQIHMDSRVNVYPKIAFGHPLTQMEPDVRPLEMEGT